MKTEGLKQALDKYGFDAAFGGARRDEEKSRAKERVYSFRDSKHRWDPKNQRPELWNVYNGKVKKGESIRVFPLSNWTELDIWQYIYLEQIPIVPLYFAAEREVIEKNGTLIMIDDDRILEHLSDEEKARIEKRMVRFRTLGCYPLTGAVESEATSLTDIIQEMLLTRTSERQGRVIDHDGAGSMEEKSGRGISRKRLQAASDKLQAGNDWSSNGFRATRCLAKIQAAHGKHLQGVRGLPRCRVQGSGNPFGAVRTQQYRRGYGTRKRQGKMPVSVDSQGILR